MDKVMLTESTVIVTGANTGIGKETAKELARRGARVILACRTQQRGDDAKAEIISDTKNENVVVKLLDLSSLESIRKFAEDINQSESRLDILVNNAGIWTADRQVTADGFEMDFGVNHLGHFYLTNLLLDKLKASAPSRIVTVSSLMHKWYSLNFDDLQLEHGWSNVKAYGCSKTANILFSKHLSNLLADTGVTTYSLHPGVIKTELGRDMSSNPFVKCCTPCFQLFQKSPDKGARTTLYCCLAPELAKETGLYYSDQKQASAKRYATDPELAERLWNISKELCHL